MPCLDLESYNVQFNDFECYLHLIFIISQTRRSNAATPPISIRPPLAADDVGLREPVLSSMTTLPSHDDNANL